MRLFNMMRKLRKNSVYLKLWILLFLIYIAFTVKEVLYSHSTNRDSNIYNERSSNDRLFYNVNEGIAGTAKSKEEFVSGRIVGSLKGGFKYVSRGNATVFDSTRGQFEIIDRFLNRKEHGFFIEIGTEGDSPGSLTFLLELERGWSGIVIEPFQKKFKALMQMKRNSKFIQSCLNITGGNWPSKEPSSQPCLTIKDILKTVGKDNIDLLVIDVSGRERHVLASFPFQYFNVSMISLELHGTSSAPVPQIMTQIKPQFESIQMMTNHIYWRTDLIFKNKHLPL